MRIIRVQHNNLVFYAELLDGAVRCLHQDLGYAGPVALSEVSIMPLVAPPKMVCVGLNYRDHALEMDMPIPSKPSFFLKPPTSLVGNGQAIVMPTDVGRVDAEAELALVIGQTCRNISPQDVPSRIFGYTCANDVTARTIQKTDPLLGHAKAYDTFCPLGPWIETQVDDVDALPVRCIINGEVRQSGNTADMIFRPSELISFISRVMTLVPGDVVLTGTPAGVSPIHPGDMVQIEIDGVGVLFNPVEELVPFDVVMQ